MKCFNRNVLIGLAAFAVALFFLVPSTRGALPLLFLLACPLSMVLMMGGMAMMGSKNSCESGQPAADTDIALKDAEIAKLNAMLRQDRSSDRS